MSEKNGKAPEEKKDPIPLPVSTAARLREIFERLTRHEREFNLVLWTAQEALGVPEGWIFDMKTSVFVPPRPPAPKRGRSRQRSKE